LVPVIRWLVLGPNKRLVNVLVAHAEMCSWR
jgi:hypothetical protein